MPRRRWGASNLETTLLGLSALWVLLLIVEEIPRVLFPWDLRVYSESPFLTTMLKLSAGQSMYTSPADSNSYVYSPGLGYITFALLRPWGVELDIRACRVVTVLLGFGAAAVAGSLCARLAAGPGRQVRPSLLALATGASVLVLFTNYTADACHPDNLYVLHAILLLAWTALAAESGSFRHALGAAALAAVGVLAKQTAIFGFFGATAVVLWFGWKAWGAKRALFVAAWGLARLVAATCCVFAGWGRYWAFQLLSREPVQWFRLHELLGQVTAMPHRLLLATLCVPSALFLWAEAPHHRRRLVAWAAIGATEVLPSLGSYLKAWGFWNNIVIVDLWMALPFLAVALRYAGVAGDDAPTTNASRAMAGGLLLALLASLVPMRAPPTEGQYVFGRALDAAIALDKAKGKRVLVSHGASTLVHNGLLGVPLDRSVSALELATAGRGLSAMRDRFSRRVYDKIYLLPVPYPADVQSIIDANYHPAGQIDGDGTAAEDELYFGTQSFMHTPVRILEVN